MSSIAGIGSRQTPEHILKEMEMIGLWAKTNGVLVNSGHAEGADYAFERGAQEFTRAFLPWKNFNKELPHLGISIDVGNNKDLDAWVDQYHPAPQNLSFGGRKLMRRNVCQILSQTLTDPVKAVVCWTASGGLSGGTAFAMRIATSLNIPILNMFFEEYSTSIKVITELQTLV